MPTPTIRSHFSEIRVPFLVFVAITLVISALVVWGHQKLPDEIAVHFAMDNSPNRFSSKWELTIAMLAVLWGDILIFGGIALFYPVIPKKLLNLPNKDVMLSPENAPVTYAFFSRWTLAIGSATAVFMGVIFYDVFLANSLREGQKLGFTLGALILYMIVVAICSGVLIWKCYGKKNSPNSV